MQISPHVKIAHFGKNGYEPGTSKGNAVMSIAVVMAQLESLWSAYDIVLGGISTTRWKRPFGTQWTLVDLPYHLAYFDHEIIAKSIREGSKPEQKELLINHRQFNRWNDQHIAEGRKLNIEDVMEYMNAGRNAIRLAVSQLKNGDVEQQVWIPLTGYGGWRTVRFVLEFCRQHTWMHFTQLRVRMGIQSSMVDPVITHAALGSIISSFKAVLNYSFAKQITLTTAFILNGEGGGFWVIDVKNGFCKIYEEEIEEVDFWLTQSPDSLVEILSNIHHPVTQILRGQLQVGGWKNLFVFLRLFRRPAPDQTIEPIP